MLPADLPDLDGVDPEALKALLIAKHKESLEQHRQLRSNSQAIEHLKLVIEKYRRMIFGRKSEKLTRELVQLEFRLEEIETTEALNRIGALHGIEEQVRGKPPDLRCSVQRAQAKLILEDFRQWMEKTLLSLSATSDISGAIRYALARWSALTRYVDDGLLEIDNSSAERALRLVSIGRKDYPFFGADSGGERAASFYTLIGKAKLCGLNPSLCLSTVLAQIADHPIHRIGELLP